jgi:hypothetical protein
MSDVAKQALSILKRVAEFLEELPDDQVTDLAEGRARLTYIPWGTSEPVRPTVARKRTSSGKVPASTVDASAVSDELRAARTPDEGRAILKRLPKMDDVRAVATEVGMPFTAKLTRDPLTDRLIEFTITSRQYGDGIRVL